MTFGFVAEETLDIALALHETHKATNYPDQRGFICPIACVLTWAIGLQQLDKILGDPADGAIPIDERTPSCQAVLK